MARSPHRVTKITHRGYGRRVGSSVGGALVGMVLVVVAFPLLFWNEGRAVQTARSLAEGRAAVVSVSAGAVNPGHEGQLVHVIGMGDTAEVLVDPAFDLSANALRLVRQVEMYQWQEHRRTETRERLGGREERVTIYEYSTTWADEWIDSGRFEDPANHTNPARMPFESLAQAAQQASVGAFRLPGRLVERIAARDLLAVTEEQLQAIAASHDGHPIRRGGEGIYVGRDPAKPQIGDARIRFQIAGPQMVSIIARQQGDTFAPYQTTSADRAIEMISAGEHTADAMFTRAEQENRMLAWALRGGGFLLMFIGFAAVLAPLRVVASFVPLLGSLVGAGTALVAGLLAFVLSLTTIGFGWIAYRPLLGVGLLMIAAVALAGLVRVAQSRRAQTLGQEAAPMRKQEI
jgi:hypothetical protein